MTAWRMVAAYFAGVGTILLFGDWFPSNNSYWTATAGILLIAGGFLFIIASDDKS